MYQKLTEYKMERLDLISLKYIKQYNLNKYNKKIILNIIKKERLKRYELSYILDRFIKNIKNRTKQLSITDGNYI